MCRSIKPLRNMDHPVTEQEIQEAALQYVRKVSGYRKPSKANEEVLTRQSMKLLMQQGRCWNC